MKLKSNKTSSSLKVGILTITAITILIFTVLWVKGRSLSAGDRFEVTFHDVNGMRAGSGVQMMGLRIGQVEEIIPVVDGKNSHVKLRFVITEKGVKVPPLSLISIQQSGLIGEQFLEITPPENKIMYVPTSKATTAIESNDSVLMLFNGEKKKIGTIVNAQVIPTRELPREKQEQISTDNTLKVEFRIDIAGLWIDADDFGIEVSKQEVLLVQNSGDVIEYPEKEEKFTVIEPMRLAEFMDLNYKMAKSLNKTNERVAKILNDEFINEITESVKNINTLTQKATTTVEKANALIDTSKKDMDEILTQSEVLISKLINLTDNINKLTGDENLRDNVMDATKAITKLSNNINCILEDEDTKEVLDDIQAISKNLNEITTYVNEFSKDPKVKKEVKQIVENVANATNQINETLASVNNLDDKDKTKITTILADVGATTKNMRKFSEKLNKRFLLFRLMF